MPAPFQLKVSSETGRLRAVLIHSPDSGIGKVVPSKAQDWLFEDIVHLESIRKNEYDYYLKLLLYFLDPGKINGRLNELQLPGASRNFFKPGHPDFYASGCVLEIQSLLTDILNTREIRAELVAAVSAIEGCTYRIQQHLMRIPAEELSRIFISGSGDNAAMLFAPIPNLIFTRDVGIVVNDHLLLSKPAKPARSREALLARYLFFNHPLFRQYRDKVLEIHDGFQSFLRPGDDQPEKTTLEGGDVMVVSPVHVLIGCSERTSVSGANEAARLLFEHAGIEKVTLVKIPHKRDFMHLDTIFTQVRKDTWVVLGSLSGKQTTPSAFNFAGSTASNDRVQIVQFRKDNAQPLPFDCLETLLSDISKNDLHCTTPVTFIYSGNKEFPFDAREQWTDSCNLLALKEGVVIGYDRNDKTIGAFRDHGFTCITVENLLQQFENGTLTPGELENTLITLPSAELSRARGGFHCMSLPLNRD